jgi:hypothetical protein
MVASGVDYRNFVPTQDDGVIIDLSKYIGQSGEGPLANFDDISHLFSIEEENRIIEFVKNLLTMSHSRISKRYDQWKLADRAHDVWVPPEATQFREKAVIADTRAIADTVLTYLMAAMAGRNPMFQLEGLDRKSRKVSAILERVLHQQMRRTEGEARLAQLLLDSVRYGFAPTKVMWDGQRNTNQIVNFDPRCCFPDPRVSWGDWNAMQFVGFVSYASFNALLRSNLYPKLKMFPGLRKLNDAHNGRTWDAHKWVKEEGNGLNIDPNKSYEVDRGTGSGYFALGDAHVVDEVWLQLSGFEIGMPGIDAIWLVVVILDEQAVIRFQLSPCGRQFPVVIGGIYHDSHKTYSQSLYDLLLPLHDIATWLLRSRIDNVQASLNNLIFADPSSVSIPDLIDRNPWGIVRSMPGAKPGEGVYIAQVPDVTRGHLNDIAFLSDMKQRLSAASDAQQGMPTADVRTATEIQRLSQLGSQRLGVLSRVASATTVRPMVRMMVGNIQDALRYEGSIRISPESTPGILSPMIQDGYLDFNVSDLQGDVDYLVVDGTLPLEPSRNAETWMNMLQILNQTGLGMEYKTGRIAEEAIRAMGVPDLDQFRISKEEQAQGPTPSQQLMLMEKMRGASVMPQDQLMQQAQAGNLIPMRR